MEGADVRVVQGGDGAGLTLEPLLQVRVSGHMLGQHLDGDGPVEACVPGLVDLTHAPGTQEGPRSEKGRGSCRPRQPAT